MTKNTMTSIRSRRLIPRFFVLPILGQQIGEWLLFHGGVAFFDSGIRSMVLVF
jgi:hypothetical protein